MQPCTFCQIVLTSAKQNPLLFVLRSPKGTCKVWVVQIWCTSSSSIYLETACVTTPLLSAQTYVYKVPVKPSVAGSVEVGESSGAEQRWRCAGSSWEGGWAEHRGLVAARWWKSYQERKVIPEQVLLFDCVFGMTAFQNRWKPERRSSAGLRQWCALSSGSSRAIAHAGRFLRIVPLV